MLCGLPGSGKTTTAKRLAAERPGVRLCPDEWLAALGFDLHDEAARADVERLQWHLGQELLALGATVVLEWGTWARSERDEVRERCRELGAAVELHHLDEPVDALWARISARNALPGEPVLAREDLLRWAASFEAPTAEELAGYDPPPGGA